MVATVCPSAEELKNYTLGRLAEKDWAAIAEHVETCPQCQAAIATVDDVADTLMTQLRGPAPADSFLNESQCQAAIGRAMNIASATGFASADMEDGNGVSPVLPEENTGKMPVPPNVAEFGEYRILEELGQGGMGAVYKALHTKLDRVVAIKILSRGRAGDQRAIARFEREMKAVGRFDHPHIVRAYDAREIDGAPVLIMEFVEGMDLGRLIQRIGPLPIADACELVRQAAVGLQYVHEHGLIHRDIKPSNLMLTPQGIVKILDLGLARFYFEKPEEEMTNSGQAMGTADYMAPEQASDSHAVDIRADIYSLGCTLYKLLAGSAPFEGSQYKGTFDKMTAHVQRPVTPIENLLPQIPRELTVVLEKMLAKDPASRFAQPAEVIEAIAQFCTGANLPDLNHKAATVGRAVTAMNCKAATSGRAPITNSARVSQPTRRRTWMSIVIGLMLLGLGLGFSLGIMVMIKKDGQTTTLEAPEGSNVKVNEQGNVTVDLKETATVGDQQRSQNLRQYPEAMPSEVRDRTPREVRGIQPDRTYRPPITRIKPGDLLLIKMNWLPVSGKSFYGGRAVIVKPDGTIPLEFCYETIKKQGGLGQIDEIDQIVVQHIKIEGLLPSEAEKEIQNLLQMRMNDGSKVYIKVDTEEKPSKSGRREVYTSDVIKAKDTAHEINLPDKLVEMTVMQREEKAIPGSGGSVIIRLGDITEGRVLLSLLTANKDYMLENTSVAQGDKVEFSAGRKIYIIHVTKLVNILIGEDYAKITVSEASDEHPQEKWRFSEENATISATGTIQPEEMVDVTAQVGGRIVSLGDDPRGATDPQYKGKTIDFNSPVEEGTVLAQIDDKMFRLHVQKAGAGYGRAKAEAVSARSSNIGIDAAQAVVEQNQADLKAAQINLENTIIKSPIKGVVIARRVNVGQNVVASSPETPSLFLIAKDLRKMQVLASVNEADIGLIHEGMTAQFTVDAFPREVFKGKVAQIRHNAAMIENAVLYTVVVNFDNSDMKLIPFMTANLKFEIDKIQNQPSTQTGNPVDGTGMKPTIPESHSIDLSSGEGKAVVPPEPYTIAPYDVLFIRAVGTLLDQPIDNNYLVEDSGTVALGPVYGRVKVQGLSLVEAEKAIKTSLEKVLRHPEVSVTLSSWVDRSKPTTPLPESYTIAPGDMLAVRAIGTLLDYPIDDFYVVEPSGTIALPPPYGRANVNGLTLVGAEKAIKETLQKILRQPEVEVTFVRYADRSKPQTQPHRITPGDILNIMANGTSLNQPIHGPYLVEPDGQVTLGPAYGRVNLKGQTFEEAEKTVIEQLRKTLEKPEVSITLEGWRKVLIPTPKSGDESRKAKVSQKTRKPSTNQATKTKEGTINPPPPLLKPVDTIWKGWERYFSPQADTQAVSINNMKQIMLAMHNYHDAMKRFPPAYKADKNGKPLLSWRVLLLPMVEEGQLFDQFHLNEPWDSEHNKQFIAKMPAVYKSPSSKADEGKTNYLTVRGEKTMFPGKEGIRMADIHDDSANTIALVEASDEKAVIWTKPDDFEYSEENPLKGLTGLYETFFLVAFADGHIQMLPNSIDPVILKALFTRDGNEEVRGKY